MNNFTGIIVRKDGEELARMNCTSEADTAGFATLAGQLQTVGYID
jgi:hypothetical protein